MEIRINTFEDLIEVIEKYDLNESQRNELVRLSLKVIVIENYNKKELISKLKTFWNKFGNGKEKPIFLGIDLDCE